MNWVITLCLAGAGACAILFIMILHRIYLELRARKVPRIFPPDEDLPVEQSEDERAAALLLRHSFVITMMERYQATGASGDVIDFINHELRNRDAGWRVRILPDGSGEFFDIAPGAMAPAKARLASGR
jgi:hypothetical protein